MSELDIAVGFLVLGLFMATAFVGAIGFFYFNPYRRIKLMRALLKKNYGIVRLRINESTYVPLIKNLNQDMLKIGNGHYVIQNGRIYRQAVDESTGKTELSEEQIAKFSFEEGVPTMFLDKNDLRPLRFENEPMETEGVRNPFQIEATLQKEIAAAEAEALKMVKSKVERLVMISMIATVLVLGITLYTLFNINTMAEQMQKVVTSIQRQVPL